LSQANCDDLVLQKGLDYVVGLNGNKLSGGERQRLALARSLLSDPAILILDEPATSLDAQGEAALTEAVMACREGRLGDKRRGMLLITHQAKSLELADEILVLNAGTVVERGGLKELRSKKSSFLNQLMPSLSEV
jgi:ABC-type multidrug transport system fused ATPase/permease subunit